MDYLFLTGASSGVGRELAIYLSGSYNLIINGRNEERLSETRALCKNNVLIWPYDLTYTTTLEDDLSGWIKDNDISIVSFVHCAGLMKMMPTNTGII